MEIELKMVDKIDSRAAGPIKKRSKKSALATDSEGPTDEALVELAQRGDRDAFRVLVERYQDRVCAIAYGVIRNREDARDIAQEAFVKAYLGLKNFSGNSSFYTWLYRITVNMAIDFRRKKGRRGGEHLELKPELITDSSASEAMDSFTGSAPQSAERIIERKQLRGKIGKAMESLSEPHRAVVTLREIDGMSYDEIAQVIGVTKGTVMSRLHYARKALQELLGDTTE